MLLVVCLEVSNNFLAIRTFNESCVGNASAKPSSIHSFYEYGGSELF